MTVPSLENAVGLDTSDRATLGRALGMDGMEAGEDEGQSSAPTSEEARFLKLAQEAESLAIQNMSAGIRNAWSRAYEAYNNKHHSGSKYYSQQYQGRSKLFRPKTRIAVRKKLKTAASALFGTGDVVAIDPQDETNDLEKASAALKQQLVNYRLRSSRRRVGIPWFMIALGAVETATVAGIVASKQSWQFREEDGETIMDRPDILLYPPENVLIDPNCDWTNPAQTAQFLGLRNYFAPGDAWAMVKRGTDVGAKVPWIPGLKRSDFDRAASSGPSDTAGTRVARDGKADTLAQATNSFKRVCMTEWFMRDEGGEYVFWTLGTDRIISTPVKVRKVYPEQKGERPVVIGVGAIEAFKVHPMSPVESWAPLQQEINDAVNLRLDHMKQIVSPPTLVKRGKKVDLKAVQGRGPNRVIMVDDPDDVSTMPMSDTPQGAFQENNYLNADMDDLTGTMNVGTVQTNQSLNETVGGMSLLAGDADSAGEFDLSVWVETWCKPAISQLVSLEEYWEDDATILAVCGMKAQLIQKYGVDKITDQLLEMDCETVIHVGVGAASHPMKRLQQFVAASNAVGGMLAPLVQGGIIQPPRPKVRAVIDEVYGSAGIKDASARFFQPIDDNAPPPQQQGQQQPDPNKWAEIQSKQQIEGVKNQTKQQELALRAQEHQDKMANAAQERQAKAESEHVRALAQVGQQIMQQRAQQQQAAMQAQHDAVKAKIAQDAETARDQAMNLHTLLKNAVDKGHDAQQTQFQERAKAVHTVLDHHAQAARAEQAHRHKLQQGLQDHVQTLQQQSHQQDAQQTMADDQRQHEAKQTDKAHGQAVALEKVRAKNKPKPTAGARPKPKGKPKK